MIKILKISYQESPFMNTSDFQSEDDFEYYELHDDNQVIGYFAAYDNHYHTNHKYIYPLISFIVSVNMKSVLECMNSYFKKPLQIMLASKETETINLLKRAGFICKRKSYDRVFAKKDLKKRDIAKVTIESFDSKTQIYQAASKLAFEYYLKTHENVNALTASLNEFQDILPKTVLCQLNNGSVMHYVFVEDHELCYVSSLNLLTFEAFAYSVFGYMFNQFDTITFETDTTDAIALKFKGFFNDERDDSFDTYVFK